ncbi:MAG: SDR family NAD(P)-dependent oxidoreductase, partial [Gemmobacter sp.]
RGDVLDAAAEATAGLHPLAMDVADEASVTGGIAAAASARGPVTICIANAGIAEGRSLTRTDLAFWRQMMAINLDGAFLTMRECLPAMREAGWGRIIAVSSIAGLRGLKGAPAYTASKHGMIGLVRAVSEDTLGSGITANALCPAYVETDIVTRNTVSIAARARISRDAALKVMVDANRHGRLIAPAEVAAAALWLCGPGSDSVSGQAIEIAGGQA